MNLFLKKIKIPLIILSILGTIFLGLAVFMTTPLFEVDFVTEESHLELGTVAEKNPAYYLDGEDWCVALSYVDTSAVRKNQVGRYPITIYHGFTSYTSYVNVTDTLAPVISCDIKTKTIPAGDVISVSKLGLKIEDASEIDSMGFCKISSSYFYTGLPEEQITDMVSAYKKGIDMWAEDFQFSFGGIYTMTIRVTDIYNNSSEITMELIVENPPIIEAPKNIYIVKDGTVDYSSYLYAWDFIETDFDTDDVSIDSSQVNLGSTGTYSVYYTAMDDYGLSSTATSTVHVCTLSELQELINTHEINISEDTIIGAKNPYDAGYFSTEDIANVQSSMEPTMVHIENDKADSFGSGFIIDIDEEFVTIATNEHVITSDLEVEVTFYDGTLRVGAVVAADPEDDIAFIRLPITDSGSDTSLTADYVNTLRTVHIDLGYWNSLPDNCGINICYSCIDINGEVWEQGEGTIIEKEAIRDWNDYRDLNQTIVSYPPVPGSSGSAIFDGYGRLVGMMRGYTDYATYSETIVVPLSEILDYYEYVFKTRVEYQ